MSDSGKGSKPRPFQVSNEEYAKRWDAIFGRDIKEDDNDDTKNSKDISTDGKLDKK